MHRLPAPPIGAARAPDRAGPAPGGEVVKPVLRAACPHCQAAFQLTDAQINAREGLVRCGACRRIFNAKWHLLERGAINPGAGNGGRSQPHQAADQGAAVAQAVAQDAPRAPHFADAESHSGPGSEPVLGDAAEFDAEWTAEFAAEVVAEAATEFVEDADPSAVHHDPGLSRQRTAPRFQPPPRPGQEPPEAGPPAHESGQSPGPPNAGPAPGGRVDMHGVDHYLKHRPNPLVNLLWSAAALIFLVLLGGQVKYFFVDRYAQHPLLRPYLAGFCEIAACQLPPRQDPRRFTLTRTQIDLHPLQPGALRVTVKLVNEATFAQPYPRLRLTLTDRDGWVVGRRTFSPGQYLRPGRPEVLRSGELGAVFLDLARPHEKAVGFQVDVVGAPASS